MEVPSEQPFSEEQARLYFRDIVLGIEYCEYPSTGSALQRVCLGPCTAGEGHLDTGGCWMSQRSPRIVCDGVAVEAAPLSSGLPRKCHRTLRKDIREIVPLFFPPFVSLWRLSWKAVAEPENGCLQCHGLSQSGNKSLSPASQGKHWPWQGW